LGILRGNFQSPRWLIRPGSKIFDPDPSLNLMKLLSIYGLKNILNNFLSLPSEARGSKEF